MESSPQDYEFYAEKWLQSVSDLTIPYQFVSLTPSELTVISRIHDIIEPLYFKQLQLINKKGETTDDIPLGNGNWLELEEVQKYLKGEDKFVSIVGKLSEIMKEGKPKFVKLSLRSAKDSLALKKKQRQFYEELIKQKNSRAREESYRLGLIVTNAEDAIEQLATSQRIYDDIGRHLKKSQQDLQIVVRPWVVIPHSLEFRIFVCNNTLTAISAYYKSELYAFLSKYKAQLQQDIQQFVQLLKKKIPFDSSVLDIGFRLQTEQLTVTDSQVQECLKSKRYQVVLIEINPFGKCSGSALFSWLEPVLQKGPLEFRLAHEETFY